MSDDERGCDACRVMGPLLTARGTSGRSWRCECGEVWPHPSDEARRIADGLRDLADEFESSQRAAPERGQGLRRVGSSPVVPLAVHDALCGWRVATVQDGGGLPLVQACAGCGMAYLQSEAGD